MFGRCWLGGKVRIMIGRDNSREERGLRRAAVGVVGMRKHCRDKVG